MQKRSVLAILKKPAFGKKDIKKSSGKLLFNQFHL